MLEVAAAITTSGVFDWVAIGAVASASGVRPKPASTLILSLTTSSWAMRLVTSGVPVSSLTISSIFLPATVSPFCAMYSFAAASICLPVEANGPVIGRMRPTRNLLSWARPRLLAASKAAATAAWIMVLLCMESPWEVGGGRGKPGRRQHAILTPDRPRAKPNVV